MDDPESKSREDESTVVQWILSFGREMVITGITISSAQLALPPLVVFSTMGLAFSLSFGVFYTTYACTAKILTLLLPIPPNQLGFLDDYIILETNEDGPQVHQEGHQQDNEIVFELDDHYTQQDLDQTEMEADYINLQIHNVTAIEDIVKEEIETTPSFDVVFGDVESASSVAFGDHVHVETTSIAAFAYVYNYKDVETPSGDVESASDVALGYHVKDVESASGVALGDVKDVESASNVAFGDVKDVEATNIVTFEEIDSQKPVEVGNKNDERMIEIHHTVFLSDENNQNSSKSYTLDMAAREVIGDADKEETAIKFDKEVAVESSASKDGIEDAILRTMEEHLIHLNAQVQEIGDENLLDERSTHNNLENIEDFDGAGDDQGHEEDVGEFLEGDNNGLHEEWKVKEPLVESWNDKNKSNKQEVDEHVKLKDQRWVGNTVEDDGVVGGSASNVDFGDVRDVETTKPVIVREIESRKLVEVGNKNEEQLSEMHHTVILCDENNLNSSEEYTPDPVAREVIGDGTDKDERTIKFDEQVVAESCQSKDGSEDAILRTMEEHSIHSNVEARVIGDENLLDERSTNNNLENFEDFDGAGDDQVYEEDAGEYLEGDDDGLHEERKAREPSVESWNDKNKNFDGSGDDQGYEEDVGEYLEGDGNGLHEERKAKEPLVESWKDKNESNTHEVDEHAKLRDKRWVGNRVEDDGVVGGSASNVDFGDVRDVENTKPVTVKEIESHKLVEVRNKNEEQLSEMHHTVILCDENNLNSSKIYTLDLVAREVIGDADKGERDEQVVARICPSKDGSEEAFLRTMEEHLTHSNAEARVISDERITNNNLVSLEGYQEDAGEDLEGEGDGLEEEQKGKQPLIESWNNEVNEDAKLRDERRVDMVEDYYDVGGSSFDVVLGDVKDVETTKSVPVKHVESQKLVEVGNENEKHTYELRHRVVLSDENNLSSKEVYTSDLAAREVIRDANKDERTIKFDETVVTKSSASTDGSEYTALRTIEEHFIHSVEDVSGLGDESLLDERKKNNNLESFEVGNEVKKIVVDDNVNAFACSPPSKRDIDNSNNVKENAGDDDVNVLVHSPSKRDTGNTKIMYKKMPLKEGNLDVDDEKIWEKIHAMKTIVGYNAPSQPTCIAELKALYVFTGVEPPASFEGDSDLDTKLKFLMEIVGVK